MSIFQNPGYLNLARQFMAGGRPNSPYAGRYPDMMGLSRSPAGQGLMQRVLQQVKRKRAAGAGQRQVKRETTEYFDGQQRPRALEGR